MTLAEQSRYSSLNQILLHPIERCKGYSVDYNEFFFSKSGIGTEVILTHMHALKWSKIRLAFLGRFLWSTRWKPLPFSSRRNRQGTFIECVMVTNSFCDCKTCSTFFFLFARVEARSSNSFLLSQVWASSNIVISSIGCVVFINNINEKSTGD